MVACYHCEYSRKTYPMIMELVKKYNSSFTFLHYPVKEKTDYFSKLGYCAYQQNPEAYWKLNDLLFTTDKAILDSAAASVQQASVVGKAANPGEPVEANLEFLVPAMENLGLDADAEVACAADPKTEEVVKTQMEEVVRTNFYGTPTVFINGTPVVGPKPFRVYAIMLKGLLYWLF
jgi:protein-disulfide isomerase